MTCEGPGFSEIEAMEYDNSVGFGGKSMMKVHCNINSVQYNSSATAGSLAPVNFVEVFYMIRWGMDYYALAINTVVARRPR